MSEENGQSEIIANASTPLANASVKPPPTGRRFTMSNPLPNVPKGIATEHKEPKVIMAENSAQEASSPQGLDALDRNEACSDDTMPSDVNDACPAETTPCTKDTPIETKEVEIPEAPSTASYLFDFCALWPLLPLTILLILQAVGSVVDMRALWYSDEIRHADVYNNVVNAGNWLILHLNGLPYPDKPALYFWFLALVDAIPFVDQPIVFMLGTAISALFTLWGTYALARITGNDRKVSFAAGLILLSTFYYVGVIHYARMDLLFTAVILASHICMYQGWRQENASLWRIAAFTLAAIATLIKGPIGLALPIITAFFFIVWQGKWRRLNARDGAFGFGLMLVILLAWVTAIWAVNGNDYLRTIFNDQIVKRAVDTWHHKQAWWHYFATFPAAWLPWTLLIFFLPWGRWLRNPIAPIIESRHAERYGTSYLWIASITGLIFLSCLSGKIVIYLLPLFPMLAILCAKIVLQLSARASRIFYALIALIFVLVGLVLIAIELFPIAKPFIEEWGFASTVALIPMEIMVLINTIQGSAITGILLLLLALALLKWTNRGQARGALLTLAVFFTLLIQPLSLYIAPSLDPVMSPKAQAEIMGAYVKDGYIPITYRMYPGTYTYYAGAHTLDIRDENWTNLEAAMAKHVKIVLAMRLSDWESWPNRPQDMHEVHRQWIVNREFVLSVLDKSPEGSVDIDVSAILAPATIDSHGDSADTNPTLVTNKTSDTADEAHLSHDASPIDETIDETDDTALSAPPHHTDTDHKKAEAPHTSDPLPPLPESKETDSSSPIEVPET